MQQKGDFIFRLEGPVIFVQTAIFGLLVVVFSM